MIFTIDRLLKDGAFTYEINKHHSNVQINLESEQFAAHHFEIQVGAEAGMTPLQFCIDGTDGRLEVANNPLKIKVESDNNGVSKGTVGEVYVGNTSFEIKYCQAKGKGLFGGYSYYELINDGDVYKIYDVNQGAKKGRNFCIYLNDVLVANAEFTNLGFVGAVYTVYSENHIDTHILVFLLMFSDAVILRNAYQDAALFVALPKEIKNKYDADFVKRISERDGK